MLAPHLRSVTLATKKQWNATFRTLAGNDVNPAFCTQPRCIPGVTAKRTFSNTPLTWQAPPHTLFLKNSCRKYPRKLQTMSQTKRENTSPNTGLVQECNSTAQYSWAWNPDKKAMHIRTSTNSASRTSNWAAVWWLRGEGVGGGGTGHGGQMVTKKSKK